MKQNVLYEDDDIDVRLQNNEEMSEFLAGALEKVKKPESKRKKTASKKQDIEQERGSDYCFGDYDYEDYDFRMNRGLFHYFNY
jgi:hypothetical protein